MHTSPSVYIFRRFTFHAVVVLFRVVSTETPRFLQGGVAPPGTGLASRICKMIPGGESCPITEMPVDETTLVYPGGLTRCMFTATKDFAFQVIPGDRDKLLFFFQAGGACWNDASTNIAKPRPCQTDLAIQPLEGIFDRTKSSNPFRHYTVVHVNYCSGDLHVGSVTRWYLDPSGRRVEQRGYQNSLAALEWAHANLDSKLTSLLITGSSSGAVGAQFWARTLLNAFDYWSAAVLADSYVGIFPTQTEGPILESFGICRTQLLAGRDELLATCRAQRLTIEEVFDATLADFPDVAFATINSKHDYMQLHFYDAVCMANMLPQRLTPGEFYFQMNQLLGRYNHHPNFVSYMIEGSDHCFLLGSELYNTDLDGKLQLGGVIHQPSLSSWISKLPVTSGDMISSQCSGDCDALVTPKMFIAPPPPMFAKPKVIAMPTNPPVFREDDSSELIADQSFDSDQPVGGAWTTYYVVLALVGASLCIGAIFETLHFTNLSRKHGSQVASEPDESELEEKTQAEVPENWSQPQANISANGLRRESRYGFVH